MTRMSDIDDILDKIDRMEGDTSTGVVNHPEDLSEMPQTLEEQLKQQLQEIQDSVQQAPLTLVTQGREDVNLANPRLQEEAKEDEQTMVKGSYHPTSTIGSSAEADLDPLLQPMPPLRREPGIPERPSSQYLAGGGDDESIRMDESDSETEEHQRIMQSTARRSPPAQDTGDLSQSALTVDTSSVVQGEPPCSTPADADRPPEDRTPEESLLALTEESWEIHLATLLRAQRYLAKPMEFEYKVMRTREKQQEWLAAQKLEDPTAWIPENHDAIKAQIDEHQAVCEEFNEEVSQYLEKIEKDCQQILPMEGGLRTPWQTLADLGKATAALEEFERQWEDSSKVVDHGRVQLCDCMHGCPDLDDDAWERLPPDLKWKHSSFTQFKSMALALAEKGRIIGELWETLRTLKSEWRGVKELVKWKDDLRASILRSGAKIVISQTDQAYKPLTRLSCRLDQLKELIERRHTWMQEQYIKLWDSVEKAALQRRNEQLQRELLKEHETYKEACAEVDAAKQREELTNEHYGRMMEELRIAREERKQAQKDAGEWRQACEAKAAMYEGTVVKYQRLNNAYQQLTLQLAQAEKDKEWHQSQCARLEEEQATQKKLGFDAGPSAASIGSQQVSSTQPTAEPVWDKRATVGWKEHQLEYSEEVRDKGKKLESDTDPNAKLTGGKGVSLSQPNQYTPVQFPSGARPRDTDRTSRPSHFYQEDVTLSSEFYSDGGAVGGHLGTEGMPPTSMGQPQGAGAPSRQQDETYVQAPARPPTGAPVQEDLGLRAIGQCLEVQSGILREMKEEKATPYPRSFPKFAGKAGDNWSSWLKRFSVAFHGASPDKKALSLWSHLEGRAFDVVTGSIETGAGDAIPAYEAMVEALNARYVPRGMEDQAYAELFSRKQQPGEEIREYADVLTKLFETANPAVGDNAFKRQVLQAAFLAGIYDPMVEVGCRAWCSGRTGYARLSELAAHAAGLKKASDPKKKKKGKDDDDSSSSESGDDRKGGKRNNWKKNKKKKQQNKNNNSSQVARVAVSNPDTDLIKAVKAQNELMLNQMKELQGSMRTAQQVSSSPVSNQYTNSQSYGYNSYNSPRPYSSGGYQNNNRGGSGRGYNGYSGYQNNPSRRGTPRFSGPQSGSYRSGHCFSCGGQGHLKADCCGIQFPNAECWSCRGTGHLASGCPNKVGQGPPRGGQGGSWGGRGQRGGFNRGFNRGGRGRGYGSAPQGQGPVVQQENGGKDSNSNQGNR